MSKQLELGGRHSLSLKEKLPIIDYVRVVCVKAADGFAHYKEGESDDTVASKFGCTKANVRGIREAVVGFLPQHAQSDNDRIAALEKRVANLEALANGLKTGGFP